MSHPLPQVFEKLQVFHHIALALALCACPSDPTSTPRGECAADADCTAAALMTHCVVDLGVCVECLDGSHCSCHELCEAQACKPLGARSADTKASAHGNWTALPGDPGYAFSSLCARDDDCPFGDFCNPFTGGCLTSADFQDSCAVLPCREGLLCEPASHRCLPPAACLTTTNCCGLAELVCETSAGLCQSVQAECTPPAQLQATCPMRPKEQNECDHSFFCSSIGLCVQCACHDDCDPQSGLPKCYGPTGLCVQQGFCMQSTECNEPLEACDVRNGLCATRCDDDGPCSATEKCDLEENVCRPKSEFPCITDALEPNDTQHAAKPILVPANNSTAQSDQLSMCQGDSDWLSLELVRGADIVIIGSSATLKATMRAYAPDGVTLLDDGHIGIGTPASVDFVANRDGRYFLEVVPDGDSIGDYRLTLTRRTGTPCADAFEDTNGINDLPTQATTVSFASATPASCTFTGALGADQHIECANVVMCAGDVDYFRIQAPRGALLTVQTQGQSGDVDLRLYGPFDSGASLLAGSALASGTTATANETVRSVARVASDYLVHVNYRRGANPTYRLVIDADVPTQACTEDDLETAGLNETSATASVLALDPGENTLPLSLCHGDRDWLRIESAAGQRLELSISDVAAAASGKLRLALGANPTSLQYRPLVPADPEQRVVVPTTAQGTYFVRIDALAELHEPTNYTLHVVWQEPPACQNDALGDRTQNQRNDTAATALVLNQPPWPSARGQSYRFEGSEASPLSLCVSDQDWYALPMSFGNAYVVRINYDALDGEAGLAIYDSLVLAAPVPIAGVPGGALAESSRDGSGWQRVRARAQSPLYVVAYNRSGWPLGAYSLELNLISDACTEDAEEENDSCQTATPLPLAPSASIDKRYVADFGPLTMCTAHGGETDYFSVPLTRGDVLTARFYYVPSEGNLDLHLHAPTQPATCATAAAVASSFDDTDNSGILQVALTLAEPRPEGLYVLQVKPRDLAGLNQFSNVYFGEVSVDRVCADDDYEPSSLAAPTDLSWGSPATLLEEPLALCSDTDWYAFAAPADRADPRVTVCAEFVHADADLDVELFDAANPTTVVASSRRKCDLESLTFSALEGHTYLVRVFPDSDDAHKNTEYTLSVLDGQVACPSAVVCN